MRLSPERKVPETQDLQAEGAVGNQAGHVHRRLAMIVRSKGGHAAHVQLERRIPQDPAQVAGIEPEVGTGQGRPGHPVQAHDLGGDALAQAVGVLGIVEKGSLGMGVGIDESGGEGETLQWNDSPGLGPGEVCDGFDLLPDDPQVGGNGRGSRAVEELSSTQDEVEGHGAERACRKAD